MSKSKLWVLPGIAILLVAIVAATGCIGSDEDDNKITIAGSTTVQPVAQAAADEYMKTHDVEITVSPGGSSVGVKNAGEGTADIGMASREVKDSEFADWPDLVVTPVAKDGIAVVVHPSNSVSDLSMEQIQKIYMGEITNWDEVGGEDLEIVVVGRDSASGTRATFEELVDVEDQVTSSMLEKQSNGAVFETVQGNENAIGYVGLGYVKEGVKGLTVDGVAPSSETVVAGTYPISRALNFITLGEPEGIVKEFIDWILTSAGQDIVEEKGFVRLS